MQRIARLSETAERVAAHALSTTQTEMEQCRLQLAELKGYRHEYARALTSGATGEPGGYQARELQVFISRVDAAISALEHKLKDQERRRDRDREAWENHLRRTKALQDVAVRASKHEMRHSETVDQQEADDRARPKSE